MAIDFTASNGDLHHISDDPNEFNDYQMAISEVGTILEPYAYKQYFAGFGFGGIPNFLGKEEVDHCFNLNGEENPTIKGGLKDLLSKYKSAL